MQQAMLDFGAASRYFGQPYTFQCRILEEKFMRVALKSSLVLAAFVFAATDASAWYCTAQSKNGATGTGFNFFQIEAEKTALKECRMSSKGQSCRITSCW